MINIDGRHILEGQKAQKFDARMRTAFFAVATVVIVGLAATYNNYVRLPEKAVCANSAQSSKLDAKFSAYYVECNR
jgi:hypothetical protein